MHEIRWPVFFFIFIINYKKDYGELYLNNYKLKDFIPLFIE